jgi:hypothetical protein
MIIDEQLEGRDLRRACIHLAAHVVVAKQLGISADFNVGREGPRDLREEPAWRGRLRLLTHEPTPPQKWALIALAGAIAEIIYDDSRAEASDIDDGLCEGFLKWSATDAERAGSVQTKHVSQCTRLVRNHWGDIVNIAEVVVCASDRAKNHAATRGRPRK